jgi:hypothetical protein
MKRNLLIAIIASAPFSAFATSVQFAAGDLLMGFRVIGSGQGAGQCYMVDVGPAATLRDATSTVTLSNLNADLVAVFGPGWHDRTDIQWGAACTTSNTTVIATDPVFTSYISEPEATAGVPQEAWQITSTTNRKSLSTLLSGMANDFKNNGVATSNNPSGVIQPDTTNLGWRNYMDGGAAIVVKSVDLSAFSEIEGVPSQTLSLFRMIDGNPASYQGHFTLSSSGSLTFTPETPTSSGTSYSDWAQANVGGQGPLLDYDNDGISNGLEYFMGTAGNAPNAGPVLTNLTITWPMSTTTIVTSFSVQTSPDLVTWTDVTATTTATSVSYTLPSSQPHLFVRLSVTLP